MPRTTFQKLKRILKKNVAVKLPHWAILFYACAAIILLPWTLYLSISLPSNELSAHWDIAWVGFDIFAISMLGATAYFAARRSLWVALTSSALGTILFIDSWFDILTSKPGYPLVKSIILASLIELPVAFLSWYFAVQAIKQGIRTPKDILAKVEELEGPFN